MASRIKNNLLTLSGLALTTALSTVSFQAQAGNAWGDLQGDGFTTDTSVDKITDITTSQMVAVGRTPTDLNIDFDETVNVETTINGTLNNDGVFVASQIDDDNLPTYINGALNSNGKIIIQDRNGIYYGNGSHVDVNGLISTTADSVNVSTDGKSVDMDGFTSDGEVVVESGASISIKDGGLAAFVSPTVVNRGVITAKAAKVELAGSNTKTTVDLYGDGLLEIAVDEENEDVLEATNRGDIINEGGVIHMTTGAAKGVVDSAVNLSGIARVDSVTQTAGKIVLGGAQTKSIEVSGKAQARGGTGGGEIFISAENVALRTSSIINARAENNGDGGTVDVNARDTLQIAGRLSAKGGDNSGNAGTINTSGTNILQISKNTEVFLSALNGNAGQWIIDPIDFNVNSTVANVFNNTLNDGANISASATRDIMVNAALNWTGGGSLTLNAGEQLDVNSIIVGNGDITLNSNSTVWSDQIRINSGGRVESTDGNVALSANQGNIYINGDVSATNGKASFQGGRVQLVGTNSIFANAVEFDATQISQQAGTVIDTQTLSGQTLMNATFAGTNNNIRNIDTFNTGTASWNEGGFTLLNGSGNRLNINDAVTTTGGDINISNNARMDVKGSATITTMGGDVGLAVTTNAFLYADGAIDTTDVSGDGDLNLSSGSNIMMRGSSDINVGDINLASGNAVIQDENAIMVGNRLTGQVDKSITLAGINNDLQTLGDIAADQSPASSVVSEISINDKNDLNVDGLVSSDSNIEITTGGSLSILNGGGVSTQGGDIALNSTNLFDLDAGGSVSAETGDISTTALMVNLGNDLQTTGVVSGQANVVNVENDTAEIQDGVDIAASSATVNVGDGTYNENINIERDVTLIGNSRTGVVVTPASDTGTSGDARAWWLVNNGVDLNLSNMTFDGAGYNVWQAIRHKGEGAIDNVAFKNITYNPSTNYQGTAVAAFGTGPVDITNSTFDNIGRVGALYFGTALSGSTFADNVYTGKGAGDWLDYALDISAGAQVDVLRNTITNNYGVASSDGSGSAGVLVSTFFGGGTAANLENNFINNNTSAVAVGFNEFDTSVVTAINNDLTGNDYAVNSSSLLSTADFSGNWWGTTDESTIAASMAGDGAANVDFTPYLDTGIDTDGATNGFQGDFSKLHVTALGNQTGSMGRIQEGVDLIEDGIRTGGARTVQVNGGTYFDNVSIDKGISVIGKSRDATIIDASGGQDGFNISTDLGSDNVTLEKLAVINAQRDGVHVADTANLNNLRISAAWLRDNGLRGLAVFGDSVQGRTQVVNSLFNDNGFASTSDGDGDILFYHHNGDISLGNVGIRGNTGGLADYGVQIIGNPTKAESGRIILNNLNVSGQYRVANLGIQQYDGLDTLSFNNVKLGGQTNLGNNSVSTAGWGGALFLSNLGESNLDLGNTEFRSHDTNYIVLGSYNGNTEFTDTDIDATNATFLGKLGTDMTLAENFAVEDKIAHQMDLAPLGLVTWKANNVFATTLSQAISNGVIQRGVNASNIGGTVNVQAGEYNENVVVDKSVNLRGAQADVSARGFPGARAGGESTLKGYLKTSAGVSGLTVNGFTFENQGDNVPGFGGKVSIALNNNANDITIINNLFDGQNIAGSRGVVTSIAGVEDVRIGDNNFFDLATGVYVNPNAVNLSMDRNDFRRNVVGTSVDGHATLTGNRFFNNSFEALGIGGTVDLTNNQFGTNAQNIAYYNGAGPDIDLTTGNNKFLSNGQFKTTSEMTLDELFALEDKTTHIMDDGSYGRVVFKNDNMYVTQNSGSIQRGVDASNDGGTLWVDDGTFNENVMVDKSITINGDGTVATTIVDGTGLGGNGFEIAASDVSLNGMIIQNFVNGINVDTNVTNLSLDDIVSRTNSYAGLRVGGAADVNGLFVTNSHFDDNNNPANASTNDYGFGWYLQKTAGNISNVTNVRVSDTTFNGNGQKGIYAEKLNDAQFTNVDVIDSGVLASRGFGNAGIDINLKHGDYADITFDNLTMSGSGLNGSRLGNAFTVKARNDGSSYSGDPATLTNLVLRNSDIAAGGDVGVAIGYGVDGALIAGNTISGPEAVIFYGGVQNTGVLGNMLTSTGLSSRGGAYGVGVFGNGGVTVVGLNEINGAGEGAGVWINDTDYSATVFNAIDGFKNGVQIDGGSQYAAVLANRLTNNTDTNAGRQASDYSTGAGVFIGGGASNVLAAANRLDSNTDGVRVMGAGSDVFVNANMVMNSADKGIIIKQTNGATVNDNEMDGNRQGIRINIADNTMATNNIIDNSVDEGIHIDRGSDNSTIVDNEITGGKTGIWVQGGQNNLIDDNDVEAFTQKGVRVTNNANGTNVTDNFIQSFEGGAVGVHVNGASNTIVGGIGNTLRNRIFDTETAVEVTGGNNTDVIGNDIRRSEFGVYGTQAGTLDINNNTIDDTAFGIDIFDSDSAVMVDNVITDSVIGIYVEEGENVLIDDNDLNRFSDAAIVLERTVNSDVTDNLLRNGNIGVDLIDAVGTQVGGDGNTLRNRIFDVSTGVRLSGDTDTVIDGNDFRRNGVAIMGDVNPFFTTSNLTVTDNTIDDSNMAVMLYNAPDALIGGANDANIITNSGGILVSNSDGVNVKNNDMTNITGAGINVIQSNNAIIADNTLTNVSGTGIIVQGGANAFIDNNTITDAVQNGVEVRNTIDADIVNNVISSTSNGAGIFVNGATGTAIVENEIGDGNIGIEVRGYANDDVPPSPIPSEDNEEEESTSTTNQLSFNVAESMNTESNDTLILGNIITNNEVGIKTTGDGVNLVQVLSNDLDNNTIGMLYEGGEIDISNLLAPNTINGGETSMIFDGPDVSLVNNSLGSTIFTDQTGNYVTLQNGALFNPGTPTVIDGLAASYNGIVPLNSILGPGILTAEDRLAIEALIQDFDDDDTLGDILVGLGFDVSEEDLFALGLFSFSPAAANVNVTFRGLPPVSAPDLAALANLAPAAGGDDTSAAELASLEPAAGGATGCWAAVNETGLETNVNFSFGGGIESAITDNTCAE